MALLRQQSTSSGGTSDLKSALVVDTDKCIVGLHPPCPSCGSPTGQYDTGFSQIIGFHRPGSITDGHSPGQTKQRKLQINGAVGVMFNFENTATDYKSGDELMLIDAANSQMTTVKLTAAGAVYTSGGISGVKLVFSTTSAYAGPASPPVRSNAKMPASSS